MLRLHATALFTLLFIFGIPVRHTVRPTPDIQKMNQDEEVWVDSVFNAMTDDERLGQLFMVRVNNKPDDPGMEERTEQLVKDYHVGGICFFRGHPSHQLSLTNHYQSIAKYPLMVAIDGEWGLSMRLDSTVKYPHNLALGAIRQNGLVYRLGREIADDCNRMGIHVNFAPVTDVNNNPNNPVINDRSFGENKFNVSAKSYMYMLGMQDNGVMACAKHFPGHGDTDVDSHLDLPVIKHSRSRLDSLELYPFKILINQGVQSIMVAHLSIPALDSTSHRPTTLSKKVVTGLLKNDLKFDGLIFTDGLGMKGVTKYFNPGEVEAEAILAGNDVLLLPESTPAAFKAIKRYIQEGKLSWERIYESTKKILHAKYRLGLNNYQPKPLTHLYYDLNRPSKRILKRELIAASITLAKNKDDIVPVRNLNSKIAVLSIGSKKKNTFQKTIANYGDFTFVNTPKNITPDRHIALVSQLQNQDLVIIGVQDMSRRPSKNFGLTHSTLNLIEALGQKTKVLLVLFGNPYSLKNFDHLRNVVVAYQEDDDTQDLTAQALFGAIGMSGKLPVTASPQFLEGQGIQTKRIQRFGYALPEEVGMDAEILTGIDSIVKKMIQLKAAPGAQVLVARKGKIVYQKNFGFHTYAKKHPVQSTDLYDLASVTKVAATTLALMKLYDEGKFAVDRPLVDFVPEVKGTNKENLITGDILAHRARLKPWIPFYRETLVPVGRRRRRRHRRMAPSKKIYQHKKKEGFSVHVAPDLYMKDAYVDSVWQWILNSDLRQSDGYRYSDLGFYLFNRAIKNLSGMPEEEFVKKKIYAPLQLSRITYLPLQCYPKNQIIPSEKDNYFRKCTLQGYVHDMGAAMLGGVSGHAGLFSDSRDLAVIFQMLLNGGTYGGRRILSQDVIQLFTRRVPGETRRGLGFDLKELAPDKPGRKENMSPLASDSTFGHLGFTGTAVWADPDKELIFVFLTNRTFPTMHNYKLNKLDIRPKIQTVIYQSIKN